MFLPVLETEDHHTDFSGDGNPQISRGLVSDAMQDIDVSCPLYRPSPTRRFAANNTEVVESQCLEDVKSGALPDAHVTVAPHHRIWDLLTDSGTELKLSIIPGLRTHFDMRTILPRAFSAATASGRSMALTVIKAAHDLIYSTLRKWSSVIGACHRWLDGYRDENCSVLRDIAREGAFGYVGPHDSKLVIDWHVKELLRYSANSIARHLENVMI